MALAGTTHGCRNGPMNGRGDEAPVRVSPLQPRPVRGRGGGLRLARPPRQIGLGDVVRRTEEDFILVECFDPKTDRCAVSGPCRLRGVLSRALQAYLAVLDEYTLADLTQKNAALARLLLPA